MGNLASWVAPIATVTTIAAACMTASNLGSRITGYGFVVFTLGSIAWFTLGMLTDQPALVWTNVVMTVLNLFGVWRWLARQATVEDGASTAAETSETMPGETLFAASLLTRAKLIGPRGEEYGAAVDAMLGCASGTPAYIVVAEGGVAGVGETLRRIDWDVAKVADERLVTTLTSAEFKRLEILERDAWPGR